MGSTMFDIHHDSPVPIHEQLTVQIRAHIASEALKSGAFLKEYRALAQELLANPQVVARAYAELTADGVLKTTPDGGMEVTAQAGVICRLRLQQSARETLRDAVIHCHDWGLTEADIRAAIEQALSAARARPVSGKQLLQAIKKPSHETSHRASQGIQDLSWQTRP
jgi:GntR family transcriptional regulator